MAGVASVMAVENTGFVRAGLAGATVGSAGESCGDGAGGEGDGSTERGGSKEHAVKKTAAKIGVRVL